jgi:Tetratricopeptide repeat
MGGGSVRHEVVLTELTEWWEDVSAGEIGSAVVLLAVPHGWGRSNVVDQLERVAGMAADGPVTLNVRIGGVPAAGRAVQAQFLQQMLAAPFTQPRIVKLLGLDSAAGEAQLGLGLAGLFVSGLAAAVPLLLASLAVTAAGNARDASPAGQQGAVARAARRLAALSVSMPVLVVVDDADQLDAGLAVTMIESLAGRYDGRVLVVAVVRPGAMLGTQLVSGDRYDLLGRVFKADADPDMGVAARAEVVRELVPDLPAAAAERIASRTGTFDDVFAVAGSDRLTELAGESGGVALAGVDAVVDAVLAHRRGQVSAEAAGVAFAGGVLCAAQATAAARVLGGAPENSDSWVIRSGSVIRVADPAAPAVGVQVAGMAASTRRQLAAVILGEAVKMASDPDATLVEKVIARQAAHRVRGELGPSSELAGVQVVLVRGLERLGDRAGAREVARTALEELPAGEDFGQARGQLMAALVRLMAAVPGQDTDPVCGQALDYAAASGAALGLEARVWAAVALLTRPGGRDAGLRLADRVRDELAGLAGSDATVSQWRMLLAFHVGRAGHPGLAQQLLAPVITRGTTAQQEAAQAILRSADGPWSDTRLQAVILEAELVATPPAADDDMLRLHAALAAGYRQLGEFRQALPHAGQEVALRQRLQGADHPQTLTARAGAAYLTGECGDPAGALRLLTELLPDRERVLGPSHADVLTTRANIAAWTGECGDQARALRLLTELLPDLLRVLGPRHPDVLATRANLASWTGRCGDAAGALRLFTELLPDQERVLGPSHPDVLTTRASIAFCTGRCGDAAGALRLFTELLPDQERVLGPSHPLVLTTRNNTALWTGECGDRAGALRLFTELLPDRERVLGPSHPGVLTTRNNVASWTGECGDAAGALRLFTELLPDLLQVLGPNHPDVLTTRNNIALWTGECGDPAGALRLFTELLPDQERVLGPSHPLVLTTRNNIALWTGECGDPAGALRLFTELLPDQERVLGPSHPGVLTTRANIASWTGECGDPAGALRLFTELLPDRERVLGPSHPGVLTTRNNIASWTGKCGDPAGALRQLTELLPDLLQVLGPNHPDVLTTRNSIATWAGRCGEPADTLRPPLDHQGEPRDPVP